MVVSLDEVVLLFFELFVVFEVFLFKICLERWGGGGGVFCARVFHVLLMVCFSWVFLKFINAV